MGWLSHHSTIHRWCLLQISKGPAAWKAQLLPTVAQSSTEAEYMEATVAGRMSLYIRSILWDLNIPQEAATILYEDNDGATAMVNADTTTITWVVSHQPILQDIWIVYEYILQ